MSIFYERRNAPRFKSGLPVWFAENFGKTLFFGQISNISNSALALVCKSGKAVPRKDCKVTVYFDIPNLNPDRQDLITLRCNGSVLRKQTEQGNPKYSQLVIKFDRPLLFDPEKLNRLNLLFIAGPEKFICQTFH